MRTAICNVELSEPLSVSDFNGCRQVMLVFRWKGRVIGRAFAAVADGRLDAADVQQIAIEAAGPELSRRWLDEHVHYDEREVTGAAPPTATVAVCTRERPDDLRYTLQALAAVAPRADVLVIDNAPATDSARRVVEGFPNVRYVREPHPGLNAARNRALREARGEVVAFTDDDAAPEEGWLDALLANFGDPRVLCVTGLTLPRELETDAQEQFERHCPFGRGFRRRVFDALRDNPLAVGPVGAGANMALRRSVLARVGGFDERLDGGTPTQSGGDHEMFARILSAGFRIVYDPAAVSWHRHRRTERELLNTVRGYGVGVYAMWTGLLWEKRELGVLKLAWSWLVHDQLRALFRNPLARAELRGCLTGPRAWFASHRARGARV
jgi:GT2 family glycosyltransferase